jgi:hypothetical protein
MLVSGRGSADPLEPPPEAPEAQDYVVEADDSLSSGEVELGMGLEGAAGARPERRRRVSFDEPDFSGTVREGRADPLAGGAIETGGAGRAIAAGKLSPRWGRGLLLGATSDPWQRVAVETERRGRGRSGEGVMLSSGRARRVALVIGRFSRRDVAGARADLGPLGVGLLHDRGRAVQGSMGWQSRGREIEAALDRTGVWRVEGAFERPLGSWRAAAEVRGGSPAFHSLAEPARGGPARALTLATHGDTPAGAARALIGLWRFSPGVAGARAAFECRRALGDAQRLAWGFEEQHGTRRDATAHASDFRQGAWMEWSGGAAPLALVVRHEGWGARGGLREPVRAVTTARLEAVGPRRVRVALTHSVFHVRRGESLYLAEAASDRLVLRSLTGDGDRSRLELAIPAGRGRVEAGVWLGTSGGVRVAPRWNLEWVRRSKPARDAAPS